MATAAKKPTGPATTGKDKPATDLAVVEQSQVPAVPSFMQKDIGKGHEQIGLEDVELPRLILLQALSPAVVEGDGIAGNFYHSIIEEMLGDSLTIVPIFVRKRFVLWNPRHMGGGILARSDDAVHWTPENEAFEIQPDKNNKKRIVTWTTQPLVKDSGLTEWGSSDPDNRDSPPAATLVFDVVLEIIERPDLGMMVLSLQRSSLKVARKLLTKLKLGDAPSFGRLFTMSSREDTNGTDNYFNFAFQGKGLVQDEATYNRFKRIYEVFSETGFKIRDEEKFQSEDEAAANDDDKSNPSI